MAYQMGKSWVSPYYLDDFLLIAHSRSEGKNGSAEILDWLNVLVVSEKLEGLAMKLKFLGIELDTV